MTRDIAFVYFDLGNILYRFDPMRSYRQLASVLECDAASVQRVMIDEGLGDSYERGECDDAEFAMWLRRGVGVQTEAGLDQILDAAGDMFDLIEPMIDIVHAVARQVGIGILSNTCHAHFDWVRRKDPKLFDGFDPIVLSYQVGVMKPAAGIYAAAEAACGHSPSSILFVDDKLENVAAARRRGWVAEVCDTPKLVCEALRQHGINVTTA